MPNPENIVPYQFKPGNVSGGRPKGSCGMRNLLEKMLATNITRSRSKGDGGSVTETRTGAEWVALSLMNKAINGDVPAIREIFERVDGKVAQTTVLSGDEEGGAVMIDVTANKEQKDALVRILKGE